MNTDTLLYSKVRYLVFKGLSVLEILDRLKLTPYRETEQCKVQEIVSSIENTLDLEQKAMLKELRIFNEQTQLRSEELTLSCTVREAARKREETTIKLQDIRNKLLNIEELP